MLFFVKAVNMNNGKYYSDLVEFADEEALIQNFEKRDLIVSSLVSIPSFLAPIIPRGGKKISLDDVIELINNLHLIIKSGLPLHQGLLDLSEDSTNKRFKSMVEKIAYDIYEGRSLSEAFEPYEYTITPMMLNLIRIGEDTGQLETTLKRGAEFLYKVSSLKKKTKSALIYPAFAFFTVLGAMLVWVVYVMPQLIGLFKDMNIELPPITVAVINISNFISDNIFYIVAGLVSVFVATTVAYRKNQRFRYLTDSFLLKIPVLKDIISSFNMAFISEYLKLSINSGVPLLSSLKTMRKNIKNELFKEALEKSLQDISQGLQLSQAFKNTKMFSRFMIRMISSAENSGTLEEQFAYISEYYYDRVDYFAQNIGKILEPAILIFVGGFMAVIIVALMGPMYDLMSNVK